MSGDSDLTERRRRDFEDQQNELAGRETGRIARFGVGATRTQEVKDKERRERAFRDALDRLLTTDPEYNKLYEELSDKLGQAEAIADETINAIQHKLAMQQDANQDMRDRAPKIDGKAVFRYADGRVVDEDGNEIDPIIAAGILWPEDTASAEDYFAGIQKENDLQASLDDWHRYRNGTLGDIRDRHEDRDSPMTKDEIRDALRDIEAQMPTATVHVENDDVVEQPTSALNKSAFPSFGD